MSQRNSHLTPSQQQEVRLAKRAQLLDESTPAYSLGAQPTHSIKDIISLYPSLSFNERTGKLVVIAGRTVSIRVGGKLCFVVLQAGDGSRIQLMLSLAVVGEEALRSFKNLVDLGDHLLVNGEVISSSTGELSIMVSSWNMASKALRPLPNLHDSLNEETRVRKPYLGWIASTDSRNMVYTRAKVVSSVRGLLGELGYIELETPMLQTVQGGAAARPFTTHSNAFDADLFLRIAPELFLKRAVVGGIDRVFEINRNFRNEGADSTHSPEFSMLEAYCAYNDYNDVAELTESLVKNAVETIHGTHMAVYADGETYDFRGTWDRISMYGSLSSALNIEITPDTPLSALKEFAEAAGITVKIPSHGKYIEELWERHVKGMLTRPTFVMDFPEDTSPLVAGHRSIPGLVEKWDLYVNGFELATGYSELIDPVVQRERLVAQAQLSGLGDDEAMPIDEEFLEALEYGMPPTGGLGMGIDRLLMALTGKGIRETIPFPLVK
jgi:lysyl-tRNA synthetase, class II